MAGDRQTGISLPPGMASLHEAALAHTLPRVQESLALPLTCHRLLLFCLLICAKPMKLGSQVSMRLLLVWLSVTSCPLLHLYPDIGFP